MNDLRVGDRVVGVYPGIYYFLRSDRVFTVAWVGDVNGRPGCRVEGYDDSFCQFRVRRVTVRKVKPDYHTETLL